ncbi:MAG: FAD binding domain-containing protein [Rubrivivax sp.]|nr:FAD binding domain-containing protein [Rubrivivax sp.]
MKPAPFDYVRPDTLAEVCALLAGDEDARVIAGGQTLVPMLAMRLARPARLIDILRLPRGGANNDRAVFLANSRKLRQTQDIDQSGRTCQAHRQHRHQRVPAGNDPRVLVAGQ